MSDVQALTMSQRNSFWTISFYLKVYLVTYDLFNSRQNFRFVFKWILILCLAKVRRIRKGPKKKLLDNEKCSVCSEPATGFNFRVPSCNACKGDVHFIRYYMNHTKKWDASSPWSFGLDFTWGSIEMHPALL